MQRLKHALFPAWRKQRVSPALDPILSRHTSVRSKGFDQRKIKLSTGREPRLPTTSNSKQGVKQQQKWAHWLRRHTWYCTHTLGFLMDSFHKSLAAKLVRRMTKSSEGPISFNSTLGICSTHFRCSRRFARHGHGHLLHQQPA